VSISIGVRFVQDTHKTGSFRTPTKQPFPYIGSFRTPTKQPFPYMNASRFLLTAGISYATLIPCHARANA
jgi:hypothetical protein